MTSATDDVHTCREELARARADLEKARQRRSASCLPSSSCGTQLPGVAADSGLPSSGYDTWLPRAASSGGAAAGCGPPLPSTTTCIDIAC
jgi:hypothetical protein